MFFKPLKQTLWGWTRVSKPLTKPSTPLLTVSLLFDCVPCPQDRPAPVDKCQCPALVLLSPPFLVVCPKADSGEVSTKLFELFISKNTMYDCNFQRRISRICRNCFQWLYVTFVRIYFKPKLSRKSCNSRNQPNWILSRIKHGRGLAFTFMVRLIGNPVPWDQRTQGCMDLPIYVRSIRSSK